MVSKTARQCHLCGNPTPSIKYGRASFVIKFNELLIAAVKYCENKVQEQRAVENHLNVTPEDWQSQNQWRLLLHSFPLLRPQTCCVTSPAVRL